MTTDPPAGRSPVLRVNSLSAKLVLLSALGIVFVVGASFFVLRARVASDVRAVFEQELAAGQERVHELQRGNLQLLLATSAIVSTNTNLRAALSFVVQERNEGRPRSDDLIATIQQEAEQVFAELDRDLLVIADDSGRVVASVGEGAPAIGRDLTNLPAVQHALFSPAPVADSSFGVLRARADGVQIPVQFGTVAIVIGGYPLGVLLLGDRIDNIMPRLAGTASLAVVTIDDAVVASSDTAFAKTGQTWSAQSSFLQPDGTEYLTASLPLGLTEDGQPAQLYIARSLSDSLDPITRSLGRNFILFGVAAILLAGLGAAVAARTSLQPLARFVTFLRSGAESGAYARFDAPDAPAEVATLTDAYNRLIDSLGKQHVELEQRSEELSVTNDALRTEITERERAQEALREREEQLRQSQKLEALGTLAGGVAHDFNNLLSVIMGYAHFALEDLKQEDPLRADVASILEAGERASGLVRQLLAFSRKQVLQPQLLDLNQVVSGMRSMLRRLIGEDIDLRMELAEELPAIHADRGQLEQVLLNLVVNARDAMPQGGTILIETNSVTVDAGIADAPESLPPGTAVSLSVSDTGIGMDAATRRRIFEPFFTTKDPGKGTGLGLATVYGIVRQSGGTIVVESEPGQGATFCAYFPAAGVTAEESVQDTVQPDELRGVETVLVAEDDALMRGMVHRCLRDRGYRVLEAADGRRALEVAASHTGPIDLLISDVIMPQLSGRELADRLRDARPDVKVLFMSGHSEEAIERYGVALDTSAFLPKPVTPDALARAVRATLDTNGHANDR